MGRDGCLPRDTGPDLHKRGGFEACLLDFYGTLARATEWVSVDVVLAEHGVELDDELRERYWNDGLDGIEHLEHSQSRDHYVAWQRERILSMLSETDLHPGEYEEVLAKLRAGNESRRLEASPSVIRRVAPRMLHPAATNPSPRRFQCALWNIRRERLSKGGSEPVRIK